MFQCWHFSFGQKLLYWKCCVGRYIVMMKNFLVTPKIWSFSITALSWTFQNMKVEYFIDFGLGEWICKDIKRAGWYSASLLHHSVCLYFHTYFFMFLYMTWIYWLIFVAQVQVYMHTIWGTVIEHTGYVCTLTWPIVTCMLAYMVLLLLLHFKY